MNRQLTKPTAKRRQTLPTPAKASSTKTKLVKTGHGKAARAASAGQISGSLGFVKQLRVKLGVPQPVFSALLGVSSRGLANWEAGQEPGQAAKKALTELDRLHTALCQIMRPDHVSLWLRSPNDRFDGLPPVKLIEAGQSDRIWRMIWQQEAGVAS